MSQEGQTRSPQARTKFLRVAGMVWAVAVGAVLMGALLAPHFGRIVDFVLYQTLQRDWARLTLNADGAFFDLSAPEQTVKSYYSALYRGDAARMQQLTSGSFRAQMHLRLTQGERPARRRQMTYRSYVRTEARQAQQAVVVEKFHLFWQRGLRFNLQRTTDAWRITGVDLVR